MTGGIDMNYYEFFPNRDELLEEIELLKAEGYYESDFHVLAIEEADPDEMQWIKYTDINFHPYFSQGEGLKSIFSANEPAKNFMQRIELSDATSVEYLERVQDGEFFLYYTDEDKYTREKDAGRTPDAGAESP